jgi:hypothetical protein
MSITLSDKLVIVERPEMQPGYCMASMADRDPKGFIDTLLSHSCFDPRVYISVSWVEETARKLGMEYPEPSDDARRVRELEEQLLEADRQLRAIEVIESAGFTARKKKKAPAKKATAKKTTKAKS